MTDKAYRIPINETQQSELARMLDQVPSRKIMNYDWTSDAGRAFIKAVREVQLAGVPLPWIGEALDVSVAALSNAVAYWERPTTTRGLTQRRRREKRPLRKATTEGEEG